MLDRPEEFSFHTLFKVNIMEHPAKVFLAFVNRFWDVLYRYKMGGKLAAAEVGLGETLSLLNPALKHGEILHQRIFAGGFILIVLWVHFSQVVRV